MGPERFKGSGFKDSERILGRRKHTADSNQNEELEGRKVKKTSKRSAEEKKVSQETAAKDLSVEEIMEEIKKGMRPGALIQHPATLIPLGICGLSFLYLLAGAPAGGAALALLAGAGAGAGGLISAGWHRLISGPKYLEKKTQEFSRSREQRQKEARRAEFKDLRQRLEDGFVSISSPEAKAGLKELRELVVEYEGVISFLSHPSQGLTLLSPDRVLQLAAETYRQGLNALATAFEIIHVIATTSPRSLEAEIAQVSQEIDELSKDESQATRVAIKKRRIESLQQRLDALKQQREQIEGLLQQADACEAALNKLRIELPTLMREGSEEKFEEVIASLEVAIRIAKEVHEELERQRENTLNA